MTKYVILYFMGRQKTLPRLERLDELVGILKSADFFTTADLAERLKVSPRTLMRDLDILRKKGFPIESDQGRGGGIRINRHWGIGRLFLSYYEVIDLLLSLAIMEKIGSPIFLENLKAIRHKIAMTFPEKQRANIQQFRQRILIGDLASHDVLRSYQAPVLGTGDLLYEAFFDMRVIDISYQDGSGKVTKRSIEPHYLFLNWPIWYVMAWDNFRDDLRCFRVDRIKILSLQETNFTLRQDQEFMKSMYDFANTL